MNIGKLAGGALFVAAVLAIWLWPQTVPVPPKDDSIRPIRSMVVKTGMKFPDLHLTGKIKANADRTLAFKQPGRIKGISVAAGQRVKKGDKLAWLDPLDFENDLAKAEAAEKRDRLSCERKREAAKKNAISQEEVSQAEALLHQSEAQLALAKRALEDTVLTAPFDGEVSEVPATELDMVTPATKIVLVHDLSKVKIDVVVPETLAISMRKIKPIATNCTVCTLASISFDSVPGRKFPAKFVEYVANANAKSQTYLATYVMDAPPDLMLLPGMSATLSISGDDYRYESETMVDAISLPEAALGIASSGEHFVWVLAETEQKGVYEAKRRTVQAGCRSGGTVAIAKGLKDGERVAIVGVHMLDEGRKVRLLAE